VPAAKRLKLSVTAESWMRKHIQDCRRGCIVAGMDFKGPIRFQSQRPSE
jgi:hypothetical protein